MGKKVAFLLFIPIVLLVGCSTKISPIKPSLYPSETPITPTLLETQGRILPKVTYTSSLTTTPAETTTATHQFLLPTATATSLQTPQPITSTPQSTPTGSYNDSLKNKCFSIGTGLPKGDDAKGTIVLVDNINEDTRGPQGKAYLYDFQTGSIESITKTDYAFFGSGAVSPDGKMLAFQQVLSGEMGKDWLAIITSDGKHIKDIPWEQDWRRVVQWLDNDRLLLTRQRATQGEFQLASVLVLNPFTGQEQEWFPDYPGIYDMFELVGFFQWRAFDEARTVYDPSLTRVVYPALGGNPSFKNSNSSIILADVSTKEIITTVYDYYQLFGSRPPQWSPDGSQFLVSLSPGVNGDAHHKYSGAELYGITRDGDINRLTYFTTLYQAGASYASWSPDSNSVAFWLTIPEGSNIASRLSILNIETDDVTSYCIPGYLHSTNVNPYYTSPIWSPDGNLLVVETIDPDHNDQRIVVLVDGSHSWAVEVAEDVTPVGWMVDP